MAQRRIIVVGHGAAGLCAALSALEAAREQGIDVHVTVVDRAPEAACGGGSRYSPSNIRMLAPDAMEPGFVDGIVAQSCGRADRAYFERLAAEAPATARWLQGQGVEFHTPPYYLAKGPARIQPVGSIGVLFEALWRSAQRAGIEFLYERELRRLRVDAGRVTGVEFGSVPGLVHADAVVLATGGFEGNATMLRQQFGPGAESLQPISPGSALNDGGGIRAALQAGAQRSGDWNGMHIEPVDARSRASAPVVLVYPYGVVIVSGPGCSVLDLTIDNNNTVGDSVALLMGSGAHGCSIRRNKIVGMTRYGIAGDSCSDCVIDDNEVTLTTPLSTFYTTGIYALASSATPSRWRISNNRLNGTGIRVDGAETVSIINNIVRGCKADAAINIYTGNNHATISGNTLSNGRPGAYPVSGDPVGGMVLRGSSHVVADNLIFDHDGTGITTHCDDSIIQNNLILDVGKWAGAAPTYHTGILNFGDRNLIQGNKVAQTGGLTDILYGYNEGTGAVDSLVIDNQFVGSAGEAVFAATPGIGVYRPLRSIRGTVTLTPGATTTTVSVPLCVAGSAVFLFPATANAAATVANAADMLYVLQANITAGQFIISHSNLATVDRTFYYHVVRG